MSYDDLTNWIPVDYTKWRSASNPNKYAIKIGGALANYKDGKNEWKEIKTEWIEQANGNYKCETDAVKVEVTTDGWLYVEVDIDGDVSTIRKKLVDVDIVEKGKGKTKQSVINFSNPQVKDNVIRYNNVINGIDVEIIKLKGGVRHKIIYNSGFLSSLTASLNLSANPQNVTLDNKSEIEFENVIDPNFVGNTEERILKVYKGKKLLFEKQHLEVENSHPITGGSIPIIQCWKCENEKTYLTEQLNAQQVNILSQLNPGKALSHNDTITIKGSHLEDTYISEYEPTYNYGQRERTIVGSYSGNELVPLIRALNVRSVLGDNAHITLAEFRAYCWYIGGSGSTCAPYRVFKYDWVEGDQTGAPPTNHGCTWTDWDSPDYEWGTAGCHNADDNGVDNTGDGTGADRKETPESSSQSINTTGWKAFELTNELVQGWYDETIEEGGISLHDDSPSASNFAAFRSNEHGVTEEKPYFYIEYDHKVIASPVKSVGSIPTPTTIVGVTKTPNPVQSTGTVQSVTLIKGEINRTPDPVQSTGTVQSVTLIKGEINRTPNPVQSTGAVQSVTLIKGEINRTPDPVQSIGSIPTPITTAGLVRIPDPVQSIGKIQSVTLIKGEISRVPDSVQSTGTIQSVTLIKGEISRVPDSVQSIGSIPIPITTAGLVKTPDSVQSIGTVQSVTLIKGKINRVPDSIQAIGSVPSVIAVTVFLYKMLEKDSKLGNFLNMNSKLGNFLNMNSNLGKEVSDNSYINFGS